MSAPELDAARLDAIHEAIAQWRMFARAARQSARAEQRQSSLEQLQAARHLAAGIEALTQIEQQHRQHGVVIDNLRRATAGAAERLEARAPFVQQLHDSADRLASSAELVEHRNVAAAVRSRTEARLAGLTDARRRVAHLDAELARIAVRHASDAHELQRLREELTALRDRSERALALLTSAGRLLGEADELYESAQVSATDLRRDVLPGPTGPRFEAPLEHGWATVPAVAVNA